MKQHNAPIFFTATVAIPVFFPSPCPLCLHPYFSFLHLRLHTTIRLPHYLPPFVAPSRDLSDFSQANRDIACLSGITGRDPYFGTYVICPICYVRLLQKTHTETNRPHKKLRHPAHLLSEKARRKKSEHCTHINCRRTKTQNWAYNPMTESFILPSRTRILHHTCTRDKPELPRFTEIITSFFAYCQT